MSVKETIIIANTGHRPKTKEDYDINSPLNLAIAKKLREHLLSHLQSGKKVHAISGMAQGSDTLYALVALKLKKQGYDIILETAIPCENHSSKWPVAAQIRWQDIVDQADIVTYVTRGPYLAYLMQIRNQYMVKKASEIVAVWDGRLTGGTYKTIQFAEKEKGKKIVRISPDELVVELHGDLLASPSDVIFHQANCQSTMGAGIAKQIAKKFPEAAKADKDFPLTNQQRLGKYSAVTVFSHKKPVEIVNLYGQLNWGRGLQTNYQALQAALYLYFNDKKRNAGSLKGLRYGFPTNMGCDRAGGDWAIVLKILEDVAQSFHIQIYTYTYQEGA